MHWQLSCGLPLAVPARVAGRVCVTVQSHSSPPPPPRLSSSHCSVLGTCIGERNRARFWLYVFFQSTALAVAIGILNTSFVWRRTLTDWVGQNALTLVTLLVLWVLQLSVTHFRGPWHAETTILT